MAPHKAGSLGLFPRTYMKVEGENRLACPLTRVHTACLCTCTHTNMKCINVRVQFSALSTFIFVQPTSTIHFQEFPIFLSYIPWKLTFYCPTLNLIITATSCSDFTLTLKFYLCVHVRVCMCVRGCTCVYLYTSPCRS